jgi:hypothetical protein
MSRICGSDLHTRTFVMMNIQRSLTAVAWFLFVHAGFAGDGPGKLNVASSRQSAFVTIAVQHDRRIGAITLEVKDSQGRTLYREEGKAMQDELVRRLDKGILPKGEHTLVITTRDLQLSERFVVE